MISSRFLIERLLLLIPIILGVITIVFGILHLTPGNPAVVMAGQFGSEELIREIERDLGLDQPIWMQYVAFVTDILRLDLGQSYVLHRGVPVSDILRSRLPVTLELAIYGQLLGIILGIPLGIISATRQDSATDHSLRVTALLGISIPVYWSGPILILIFSVFFGIFPTSGRIATQHSIDPITGMITVDTLLRGNFEAFVSAVHHLFLPSLVIGLVSMAHISRMMRSSLLEVIRQDYIRTARAKGQGRKITIMRHGFRNALIPVITIIGLQFGTLLGGTVITEIVFGIGGIGLLLVQAIQLTDYPVVLGTVLIFALLFTTVNLIVDILYSVLDPRIEQ